MPDESVFTEDEENGSQEENQENIEDPEVDKSNEEESSAPDLENNP